MPEERSSPVMDTLVSRFQRLLLVLSCIDLLDCPVAVADDVDALGGCVGLDALEGVDTSITPGSLAICVFVIINFVYG